MFPYYIFEGQMEESMPKGFVRLIEPQHEFIGTLKNMVYTMDKGGIYITDNRPTYTGIWSHEKRWKYDKPIKNVNLNDFTFWKEWKIWDIYKQVEINKDNKI